MSYVIVFIAGVFAPKIAKYVYAKVKGTTTPTTGTDAPTQ